MSANTNAAIGRVAVFGSGPVAMSAAIALARALPKASVMLFKTPPEPGALADRLPATLPSPSNFAELIGASEGLLLKSGAAEYRLGARFDRWGRDQRSWTQGFGRAPVLPVAGAVHQHWLGAMRRGCAAPWSDYHPSSALAAADRIVEPSTSSGALLNSVATTLRFDAVLAERILSAGAAAAGVRTIAGTIGDIAPTPQGLCAEVRLGDGQIVAADLFVDASGPTAALARHFDDGFVGWDAWLPANRLLLTRERDAGSLTDRYEALDIGWRAEWRLGTKKIVGLAYAAEKTDEERARRALGEAGDTAELVEFRCGRRVSLAANVLALGDAAVAAGPLAWPGFAIAHAQLVIFLELLPGRIPDPLLIAEINRRTALRADRVRDYLAAHYIVRPRADGEFWRPLGCSPLPGGLDETVTQFGRRGTVPQVDEESFSREDWAGLLVGLGIVPELPDPIAASVPAARADGVLAQLRLAVAAMVEEAEPYLAYLRRIERAP